VLLALTRAGWLLGVTLLDLITAIALLAGEFNAAVSDGDERPRRRVGGATPGGGDPIRNPPGREAGTGPNGQAVGWRSDVASMATPRHRRARPYALPDAGIAPAAGVTERDPTGPVIVGVDGSERSIDALALADRLGAALRRPVVIAYVHPYGELASLFSEGEYERLVREVAESTFDQIEHLPSVPERRMELVTEASPAAGLHTTAEREGASFTVIGSSNRSRIGRILVGGTGERLLSGASAPVAVAPPATRPPPAGWGWSGAVSTARGSRAEPSRGRARSRGRCPPDYLS
jgi:nucleotide-binding universal stress UspA family protein